MYWEDVGYVLVNLLVKCIVKLVIFVNLLVTLLVIAGLMFCVIYWLTLGLCMC